ncbi:hypothetical protein Q3G72_016758 [Acer saccharum]|nr:hypothetical protein Q3G72_016758 [Acer saccharum]
MASSDQGESYRLGSRGDRWQKVGDEVTVKERVQKVTSQRKKAGDRLGVQISHTENLLSQKFKVGGSADKGKQAWVRNSKSRTSHPTCVNDKLVLKKKKVVRGRAESWTTSSEEETEEGQFRDFGLVRGECSKFKSLGKGLKSDGPIQGQQDIGLLASSEDGLSDSNVQQTEGNITSGDKGMSKSSSQDLGQINKPQKKRFMSSSDSPKQILMRNSEQRVAYFLDNDGRLVNLPMTGPIQLPLRDGQGGIGKDFIEVPLTVEIEGAGRMEVATKSKFVRRYWSLEEEFTKVIEKGVALGHIVTSKDMKRGGRSDSQVDNDQDQQNDVLRIANSSWNLEEEVTKDVYGAGGEASATTIDWALSELMKIPRVMTKAQAEVREVFNRNKEVDETGICEMNFLKLVIKETLRLHPPGPLLAPRVCREKCEIKGFNIPNQTTVFVNAWAIGRDPEYWSDPESFIPERFLDSAIDYKGNDFEYIPFGASRRICPGMSFGLANVELPLGMLLYHFDWKLPDGMKHEDLNMTETFGIVVRRKEDLYIVPHRYCPSFAA